MKPSSSTMGAAGGSGGPPPPPGPLPAASGWLPFIDDSVTSMLSRVSSMLVIFLNKKNSMSIKKMTRGFDSSRESTYVISYESEIF